MSIPDLVLDRLSPEVALARGVESAAANQRLVLAVLALGGLLAFGLDQACEWSQQQVVNPAAGSLAAAGGQLLVIAGRVLALALFLPLAFALHWHISGAEQGRLDEVDGQIPSEE